MQMTGGRAGEAAAHIGKDVKFVKRWHDRFKATGGVSDKARVGRPHVLSAEAKTKARVLATRRTNESIRNIAAKLDCLDKPGTRPSKSTVHRALRQGKKRMVYKKQSVTKELPDKVKRRRLEFCRKHSKRSWRNVMALDSKIFQLRGGQGAKHWHYAGVHKKVSGMKEKRKLHVYGAACVHGVAPLRVVSGTTGYKKKYFSKGRGQLSGVGGEEFSDVLQDTIIPAGKKFFGSEPFELLMDNAKPHTTRCAKRVMEQHGVRIVEDWPADSPDLNWIENLWAAMSHRLECTSFNTVQSLKTAVFRHWDALPKSMLKGCVASMRNRMRKCIQLKGGHTGY